VRKVLIADDETNIRNILDFTLHAEGFEAIAARSGDEAFTLAVSEQPALVILDVMMPGTSGIEICRRLKQDPRTHHLPVVLLTARASGEDRAAGTAAGADAYVTKPFSPHKVVEVVERLLGAGRS
jgi:DNA-binding response OmpR family regulator